MTILVAAVIFILGAAVGFGVAIGLAMCAAD